MSDHKLQGRVFVTQENTNLNYQPAEVYGEVLFLTRHDVSPIKGSLTNEALVAEVRSKLASFDSYLDYIVPTGSPAVAAIAFALLRERTDRFNLLRWSNRDRVYQCIPVQL